MNHFEEYTYSFLYWALDKKIDNTLISVKNEAG